MTIFTKNLHSSLNVSHSFPTHSLPHPHPLPIIQTFTPCHPTPQTLFPMTTRHHQAYPCQKLLPFTSSTTSATRRPDIFKNPFYFRRIQTLTLFSLLSLSLSLSLQLNFFNLKYVRKRKRWTRKEKGKEHFPLGKGRTSVPSRTYRSLLEERWIQQTCRRWCPSLHGRRP